MLEKYSIFRQVVEQILSQNELVRFTCNVCGRISKAPVCRLGREDVSCRCGSTVRVRSLIYLLSKNIYGEGLAIKQFSRRDEIFGIDMSGSSVYSGRLTKKINYLNTYYHKEPTLDILNPREELVGKCDFVISSDVFEHVGHPVSVAFTNTYKLLKNGGIFILTVPYTLDRYTVEHFPKLRDYHIELHNGEKVLVNTDAAGVREEFRGLVFHGGEGETLEMRVFSKDSLLSELEKAGFVDIKIHDEPHEEFGIFWRNNWSLPITARRPG